MADPAKGTLMSSPKTEAVEIKGKCFLKIILIGEGEVGKTSLLLRMTDNLFSSNLDRTFGVDYRRLVTVLDEVEVTVRYGTQLAPIGNELWPAIITAMPTVLFLFMTSLALKLSSLWNFGTMNSKSTAISSP
ncbi:hypothetical protein HDE_03630 [Halotydeus destructor]|nr:hypothetical protein HDE_03630 [Halotydeus destructor]